MRLAAAACLAAQSMEGRLGLRPDGGRVLFKADEREGKRRFRAVRISNERVAERV